MGLRFYDDMVDAYAWHLDSKIDQEIVGWLEEIVRHRVMSTRRLALP